MQEIFFFNKNISFEINVHTDVSIRQEVFVKIQMYASGLEISEFKIDSLLIHECKFESIWSLPAGSRNGFELDWQEVEFTELQSNEISKVQGNLTNY